MFNHFLINHYLQVVLNAIRIKDQHNLTLTQETASVATILLTDSSAGKMFQHIHILRCQAHVSHVTQAIVPWPHTQRKGIASLATCLTALVPGFLERASLTIHFQARANLAMPSIVPCSLIQQLVTVKSVMKILTEI